VVYQGYSLCSECFIAQSEIAGAEGDLSWFIELERLLGQVEEKDEDLP